MSLWDGQHLFPACPWWSTASLAVVQGKQKTHITETLHKCRQHKQTLARPNVKPWLTHASAVKWLSGINHLHLPSDHYSHRAALLQDPSPFTGRWWPALSCDLLTAALGVAHKETDASCLGGRRCDEIEHDSQHSMSMVTLNQLGGPS